MTPAILERLSPIQRASLKGADDLGPLLQEKDGVSHAAALDACDATAAIIEGDMKGKPFAEALALRPDDMLARQIFDIVLAQRLAAIAVDDTPQGVSVDPKTGLLTVSRGKRETGFKGRLQDIDGFFDSRGGFLSAKDKDARDAFLWLAGRILAGLIAEAAENGHTLSDPAAWTKSSPIVDAAVKAAGPNAEAIVRHCANLNVRLGEHANALEATAPGTVETTFLALLAIADHLEKTEASAKAERAKRLVQINDADIAKAKEAGDKRRAKEAEEAKNQALKAVGMLAEALKTRDVLLEVRLTKGDAALLKDVKNVGGDKDQALRLVGRIVRVLEAGDPILDRRLIEISVFPAWLRSILNAAGLGDF